MGINRQFFSYNKYFFLDLGEVGGHIIDMPSTASCFAAMKLL
jgi:hypothetical protein